ncbi:unnamed protein product [Symbiodinium microadriaticum]|nr:unnamed protein product [Symbiodinium microadriaticum]
MAGYHQNARVTTPTDVFLVHEDQRYFRTSDLVRRERGGIVFKGRADMMAKSGGKWVDMTAVEDNANEQFHAFLSLSGEQMLRPDRVLDAVRQKLPPKVQLWLVSDLPRHPVTRKIDLARLYRVIQAPPASWPLENCEPTPMYRSRLHETLHSQVLWTMVAVGTSCVCGCPTGDLPRQLGLTAAWLATLRFLAGLPKTASVPRIAATVLWLLALPRWNKDDDRQQGLPMGVWIFRSTQFFLAGWIVDELPLWKFGFFVWTALLRHAPAPLGWTAAAALAAATATGAILAGRRGRLGAWPVLFWSIGIGHQLEMDIRSWVYLATWRVDLSHGNASDHAKKMLGLCQEQLMRFWPAPPASEEKAEEKPEEAAQEPAKCTGCGQVGRWALTLPRRKILCESCTQSLSATAEANVAAFVEGASPGLAEPLAKRPRLDPGAGGEVSYLQRLNALPGKQGLRAKGQSSVSGDLVDGVQRWPLRLHLYD